MIGVDEVKTPFEGIDISHWQNPERVKRYSLKELHDYGHRLFKIGVFAGLALGAALMMVWFLISAIL